MNARTPLYPTVTLIGRPNVGKSTLFNRLIGKRQAIVADIAGTTRDRIERLVEWDGTWFTLTDVAGLEVSLTQDTPLARGVQAQVERALSDAAVLVWVVDGSAGMTHEDEQIVNILRHTNKPVIVAVNKCDHSNHDINQYEFSAAGFSNLITLSALHGRGINDLLDAMLAALPERSLPAPLKEEELRLSIVGRPNVGKSTLLNTLAGDERSVVSDVPGTTRDAVDTKVDSEKIFHEAFNQWASVEIIDTAGIRRRGKIGRGLENWSLVRTLDAIKESSVVLFVIDAMEGLVHQDLQISQQIIDAGRAVILVVNKWDLVLEKKKIEAGSEEDLAAQEHFLIHLRQTAPFLYWIQVLFISAKERINTDVIGMLVADAYRGWNLEVSEEQLAEVAAGLQKYPRLKNLQKITLEHNRPPVFHLHVEGKNLPHFSTVRHAENVLREELGIGPVPIKIWTVTSLPKHPYKKR